MSSSLKIPKKAPGGGGIWLSWSSLLFFFEHLQTANQVDDSRVNLPVGDLSEKPSQMPSECFSEAPNSSLSLSTA